MVCTDDSPSSNMSSTLNSNMRARMRLSGRFFVCDPSANSDALFFSHRKRNEASFSNGRSSVLRVKFFEVSGPWILHRSRSSRRMVSLHVVLRMNSAVRSSSIICGSFF